MEYLVVAEDLWKSYDGVEAVRGVSFRVEPGTVFGLIGPNGAGKTTTLRMLVGLLRPDRGRVSLAGYDPHRDHVEARRILGYLPEDAGVYKHLTGLDFLWFIARLYYDSEEEAREAVEWAARASGLGEALRRRMNSYSKGMKRRLLLARTLMTRPRVVVLDEPTSGLDVYSSVEMRRLIRGYARESGAAVVVSSHNMLEVEYLCDRIAFIEKGRIIVEGTPAEVRERYGASNLEEAFIAAVEEARRGGAG